MKKKQGSQASSAAAAEKEIVSVETISDIKYLAEKSKKSVTRWALMRRVK